MKVLLVAPIDPKIPGNLSHLMGGESTYTSNLLRNPPKGIIYTYYLDAVSKNQVERLNPWWNILLNVLIKLRILPVSPGTIILKIKGRFDLVHCHSYSIKIIHDNVPVLISDSSSNYIFLRDYINWSPLRIKLTYFFKKVLFRLIGILDCELNFQNVAKIIVFSKFAKRVHLRLGVSKERIEVIYPGIPHYSSNEMRSNKFSLRSNSNQMVNILFVGIWFERKGGQLLLEAYRKLSKKYENIELTIVGPIPKRFKIHDLRLKSYDYIPREKLMKEFFPKADIFVLVPPKVEGFGFAVLEAMSFGIPVIVSRVCALPELVSDGETGFIVKAGSVLELTKRLENLILDKNLRKRMAQAPRARFLEKYSASVMNNKLLRAYKSAIENV